MAKLFKSLNTENEAQNKEKTSHPRGYQELRYQDRKTAWSGREGGSKVQVSHRSDQLRWEKRHKDVEVKLRTTPGRPGLSK